MTTRTIDFLRPARTPRLGWLLLAAGALALGVAVRLEQRLDDARALRDQATAERERVDEQARQRVALAARPTPEVHRLAGATSEMQRPWLLTLQGVEAATTPPVYVLNFSVDSAKGRIHLEGEVPDFEQAVAYVERLGQAASVVQPRLVSHEQVTDPATAHAVVKFIVEASWSAAP
jgi:hypothetical protein